MSRRTVAWQLRIKPSGRVLRVPICPSAGVGSIKGASPMQAYCVSKRPPRALYLGLAIALGMVAVSTVVLSQMGGCLLRDGPYLRLLGYSPSNRGASRTALGAADAGASRGVLSASSAPGPTPAPPRAEVAQGPSDAPANATPSPAPSSDRNPDPVHADVPAMRELNETSRDLANGSLDSFGLGVLPHDADHVRGAPDLMHFDMPSNDDGNCTWKNEYTATDANHDGHPEYVHGRMLGTCLLDANQNGIPEAGMTIARDFQLWDKDSDGTFSALVGRHAVDAFADPNEDHVHEYTAQGLWTLNVQDANGDKKPESIMVTFAGEQRFDRNENGNADFVRTVHAELCMTDTASDGTPDSADFEVHAYQTYDIGDN